MNYFAVLTTGQYLLFFLYLISWDIIGFGLFSSALKQHHFIRPIVWFFGLGLYSLLIFSVHFFYPYTSTLIPLGNFLIALLFLPVYLKSSGPKSLLDFFRGHKPYLLIFLPLLPLLFIKSSLPPYAWDEMTYHFVSPFVLNYEQRWVFGGLYNNLPRTLETAWIGLFAVFKTYMPARLVHSLIFISFQLCLYSFLSHRSSKLIALTAVSLLNLLSIPAEATLGYVDVAAASFITLAFLVGFYSLISRHSNLLPISLALWGLALGSKYNALLPAAIFFGFILIAFVLMKSQALTKPFFLGLILLTLMGGYWYAKNLVLYRTPIYPFGCTSPQCQNFLAGFKAAWAGTGESFSALWVSLARQLSLRRLGLIIPASLIGIVLLWRSRLAQVLALILTLDILVSAKLFIFIPRYYYHWLFLATAIFGLLARAALSARKLFIFPLLFIFSLQLFRLSKNTLAYFTNPDSQREIKFSLGQSTVSDWIAAVLPRTHQVVEWCNRQSQTQYLVKLDPDLIWFDSQGRFDIFLANCAFTGLAETGQSYLVSLSSCLPEVTAKHSLEDEQVLSLRRQNNDLVCRSQPVVPGLYVYTAQN